jgi:hypothetical protein
MIKAKAWNGKDLKGTWEVTLKIDGVRALYVLTEVGPMWLSRAGKPLYNVPDPTASRTKVFTDCEVYLPTFKDTIRAVRTKSPKDDTPPIRPEHLYSLDPLDSRLKGSACKGLPNSVEAPTAARIRQMLKAANFAGYEGLVLRQGDKWLKVKPEETHDVLVTGVIEGTGKHKGRLGALITGKGKVGTGFSDTERQDFWHWHITGHNGEHDEPLVGRTIEVSCMHFTSGGMFRHPRFVRMRPDKNAEG